jgi:hypothetical protein
MSVIEERRPIPSETALKYLIHYARQPVNVGFNSYGYEVYIPNVILSYLQNEEGRPEPSDDRKQGVSSAFYEAAWELCRRGILRFGVVRLGAQETTDGSAGNGYSITQFGRIWMAESDQDAFVPTEPERFGHMCAYRPNMNAGIGRT